MGRGAAHQRPSRPHEPQSPEKYLGPNCSKDLASDRGARIPQPRDRGLVQRVAWRSLPIGEAQTDDPPSNCHGENRPIVYRRWSQPCLTPCHRDGDPHYHTQKECGWVCATQSINRTAMARRTQSRRSSGSFLGQPKHRLHPRHLRHGENEVELGR